MSSNIGKVHNRIFEIVVCSTKQIGILNPPRSPLEKEEERIPRDSLSEKREAIFPLGPPLEKEGYGSQVGPGSGPAGLNRQAAKVLLI